MATDISLPGVGLGRREWVILVGSSTLVALSFLAPVGSALGLVLVITLGLFLTAQRAPHVVVCLLLTYLCFEQFIFSLATGEVILMLKPVPEVVLILVLVARAPDLLRSCRELRAGLLIIGTAILVVAVSWLVNGNPLDDGLYYARKILRYTPLLLVMPIAFRAVRARESLKRCLLALAAVQVGVGLLQLAVGEQAYLFFRPSLETLSFHAYDVPVANRLNVIEGTRLIGTLGSYMDYALLLFLGACFALPDLLKRDRDTGWHARALFFLALCLCILLSFSRMTMAAAVLGFGACFLLAKRRAMLLGFLGLCLCVALLPYILSLNAQESAERATGVLNRVWGSYDQMYLDPMRYSRAFLSFVVAPSVLVAAPLTGIGPGFDNFGALGLPSWRIPLYLMDNGYVNLLVHYGLLGLGTFVTLVTWLILTVRGALIKATSDARRAHLMSLLTYVIGMAAVHFFVDVTSARYASFAFWLVAGLAVQVVASGAAEKDELA